MRRTSRRIDARREVRGWVRSGDRPHRLHDDAVHTPGRAAGTSWPEFVVTMWAAARLAMKNSACVGIALSSRATISHLGTEAGGFTVAGSFSADAVIGRWVTAAMAVWAADRPPA